MSETSSQSMPWKYLTAKGFCITSAFWMVIATLMGLIGATELIAPDLVANIGWLVFGRIRPVHINLVLFGFVTPGLIAAAAAIMGKMSERHKGAAMQILQEKASKGERPAA